VRFYLVVFLVCQVRLLVDYIDRQLDHASVDQERSEPQVVQLDRAVFQCDAYNERVKRDVDRVGKGVVLALVQPVEEEEDIAVFL